jgi:hypothetical protein
MNFIIAVISESYEKVMMKLTSEVYRQKANLIYERELHFTQKDFDNKELFPYFIIIRRVASSSDSV